MKVSPNNKIFFFPVLKRQLLLNTIVIIEVDETN